MSFVKSNDMVEDLAAAASHRALCDSILPRCLNARALRLQTGCLQEGDHIGIEFRVVVQDDITIRTSLGKRRTQWLQDPLGGRMTSDVEVQDSAALMLDHEEAIEEAEGQRGHGKEVECDDHLAMIGEEGEPAFGWIEAPRPHASEVSGYRAFGDLEA